MLKRFRVFSISLISIGLILISCIPSTQTTSTQTTSTQTTSTLRGLGIEYEKGWNGVEQDYEKARYWYEQAASEGDAYSKYALGSMYQEGLGVEQDYEKARYWYEQAASEDASSEGNLLARFSLGSMYEEGLGVEQDYEKARYWYEQVASQYVYTGYAHGAKNKIGDTYYAEQDYEKARYSYQQAASEGNENAKFGLAYLYEEGLGVEQDYEKARYWYKQVADQGSDLIQRALEALPQETTTTLQGNVGQANDGASAIDSPICGNGDFDNLRTILPIYNIPDLKDALDSAFAGDFQTIYAEGKTQGYQTSDLIKRLRDAQEQFSQNRESSIQALNQWLTVDPVAWIAAIDAGTADAFIFGDESKGPLGQDANWSRSYLLAQYSLARVNMIIACYEEVE